jgi:hypothetical protein
MSRLRYTVFVDVPQELVEDGFDLCADVVYGMLWHHGVGKGDGVTVEVDGPNPGTKLVTLRKEDCAPLLVPEDRVADFADAGWDPEEPIEDDEDDDAGEVA